MPRTKPKFSAPQEVALRSPTRQEDLPWPVVHYPDHYGTFLAFSDGKGAHPALCRCVESAVINYFRLREDYLGPQYAHDRNLVEREFYEPLWLAESRNSGLHNESPRLGAFPYAIVKGLLSNLENPLETLRFEPQLCHRCNLTTPSLRYAHEMYAGRFKQNYGWYISQTAYRLGVSHFGDRYLQDICPTDIMDSIKEWREVSAAAMARSKALLESSSAGRKRVLAIANLEDESDEVLREKWRSGYSEANKLKRKIDNVFENITRKEFGFRKVGEGWISESILHSIVEKIFPGEEILRHHHPPWLQGLELDIYLPGRRLAFEYQGQQHFHVIPAWGGESGLSALKARDRLKAKRCVEESIRLITVDYTEALTVDHVKDVIQSIGDPKSTRQG